MCELLNFFKYVKNLIEYLTISKPYDIILEKYG